MKLKIKYIAIALLCNWVWQLNAQQLTPTVTSSQGGTWRNGNTVLTYTIGQPPTQVMQVNNLMLTPGFEQPIKPEPPVAPASQTACSDTPITFIFPNVQPGKGGGKIQYSLTSSFTFSGFVNFHDTISVVVNPGTTDTIWMMSVDTCSHVTGNMIFTTATVTVKPYPPTPPAPQTVSSDTAYTFHYVNLKPGSYGNQLEWSLDSNFTTAYLMSCADTVSGGRDSTNCAINVKVSPNSDTVIWFRSIDSISGCMSNAKTTIAIVSNAYMRQSISVDSIVSICSGSSFNIAIHSSKDTLRYSLRTDTGVVNSAMGNDTILYLSTGAISANTLFNILTTDTANGDTANLGLGILVQALSAVDSNVMIEGDTFIYSGDTVCYTAGATNGIRYVYYIIGGTATVDSLTGCVHGAAGSFTLQATAFGLPGCGTATGNLSVSVTGVAPPIAPAPIRAYIDSATADTTLTFYGIAAGSGGDEIEWATNPNFIDSNIIASGGSINIAMHGAGDSVIWLRTMDSKTGRHSPTVKSEASALPYTISAALLDKSQWVYSGTYSDEFNYAISAPGSPSMIYPDDPNHFIVQQTNFMNTWGLVGGSGTGASRYGINESCNYFADDSTNYGGGTDNWSGRDDAVNDWGNCPANPYATSWMTQPGSNHEVGFSYDAATGVGAVNLYATPLSPPAQITCWQGWGNCNPCTGTLPYSSGTLWSIEPFPLMNSMWEIRAKLPPAGSAWPAFWNYTGNGDFTVIDGSAGANIVHNALGDDPQGDCNMQVTKQTPCNFDEDYHTYTALTTPTEIFFFVDGKEEWSTLVQGSPPYPTDIFSGSSPFNIGLGENIGWTGTTSQVDFAIDYFRYYTPKPGLNSNTLHLNSIQNVPTGGAAQTLESLYNNYIPTYNEPPLNNNALPISNTNGNTTHQIADANIAYSNQPGQEKIFYAGADGRLYNTYWNGSSWVEYPLTNNGADVLGVMGGITCDNDRVFYYDVNFNVNFFQWINTGSGYQWAQFSTGVTCTGPLTVDQLHRVWYIGTDGYVHAWCPDGAYTGQDVKISTTSGAQNDLTVAQCGCLMFYTDNSNNLVQQSWWNSWNSQGEVATYVAPSMTMDETNGILYYMGGDHDVHAYTWAYNNPNPSGLKKLGSSCSASDNAHYSAFLPGVNTGLYNTLALSNNKNMIYYWGMDNYLWYYYNDNDAPERINWYRTPVNYYDQTTGTMAVEPWGLGRLFYVSSVDNALHYIQWENADNPVYCPDTFFHSNHDPNASFYMYQIPDSVNNATDSLQNLSISVFPNPSNATFTFSAVFSNGSQSGNLDIKIFDVNGSSVGELKTIFQSGTTSTSVWDASNIISGVYYYKAQANNGSDFVGKLVKM